ncbi:MAG: NAD(P)H-binding protein [Chloroflexota bacterium]|nr:NAD(P)H-binding protein [Chloroflexota bacterium]
MILLTGATGFIGRHLLRHLLTEGVAVRCLLDARRAAAVPAVIGDLSVPEIVVGALDDEETAFRAVTGVDAVFHLESAQWWGRPRDLEAVELEGTRALVTAARSARVGRLIMMSHLGAAPASAFALLRYKGQVEEVVRGSGLAYTIIRSGVLFGEEDSFVNHLAMQLRATPGVFLMPGRGEVVLHPLYIGDLVRALAGCLESIDTVDALIEIGGPEYMSLEDMMRTIMRVSGASRALLSMPPYALRAVAAAYDRVLPRAIITPQWFDLIATNKTAPLNNFYRYFGFQPRRFEDTLLTYMPHKRYGRDLLRQTFKRRPKRPLFVAAVR